MLPCSISEFIESKIFLHRESLSGIGSRAARSFPPLRTYEGPRTNLIAQLTSFVGREKEMETAQKLLEHGHLVTLTGPGGTGKTGLALQVAGQVSDKFRDGVWLVELASLTTEAMVLPAVAQVFALQPVQGRSLEKVVADFFRDKSMLLLLDNCEHLIQACAALATELLEGAAGLKILASSREALGVRGEMILWVPFVDFATDFRREKSIKLSVTRKRSNYFPKEDKLSSTISK